MPRKEFDVRAEARDFIRRHETTFYNLAARDAGVPQRPYQDAKPRDE